jgi:hypothetical protein
MATASHKPDLVAVNEAAFAWGVRGERPPPAPEAAPPPPAAEGRGVRQRLGLH